MKTFGEEDMIKLQDAPAKLVKKICELMGNDRDNVKKFTRVIFRILIQKGGSIILNNYEIIL